MKKSSCALAARALKLDGRATCAQFFALIAFVAALLTCAQGWQPTPPVMFGAGSAAILGGLLLAFAYSDAERGLDQLKKRWKGQAFEQRQRVWWLAPLYYLRPLTGLRGPRRIETVQREYESRFLNIGGGVLLRLLVLLICPVAVLATRRVPRRRILLFALGALALTHVNGLSAFADELAKLVRVLL